MKIITFESKKFVQILIFTGITMRRKITTEVSVPKKLLTGINEYLHHCNHLQFTNVELKYGNN